MLDAGLFAPALDQWHPGQPHLVEFVMRRPDSNNASGAVANITSLASAGYRATAQQVADLTGLQVTDSGGAQSPVTPETAPAFSALMARTHRRFAPLIKYPPARAVFDAACNSRIDLANRIMQQAAHPAPETSTADAPLSDKELAAIKAVGGLSVADLLHTDAPALERGMAAAIATVRPRATNKTRGADDNNNRRKKSGNEKKTECRSSDPPHCPTHGTPIKRVHHSKWTPRTLPQDITAAEAQKLLADGGYKLTDPTGEEITVDDKSIAHWVKAGKTEEDKNARLAMLPTLDALITHPHEIWEGTFIDEETGAPILQRTYLARFQRKDENNGKMYGKPKNVLAFTHTINQKTHTHTFREASDIEAKREGKLVYADTEKTAAPSA